MTPVSPNFSVLRNIWFYWFALIITVLSGAGLFLEKHHHPQRVDGDGISLVEDRPAAIHDPQAPELAPGRAGHAAFKEWEAIVEALGQGAQIILLRKGGIAEGRAGFQAKHPKFWLFPTRFHQQWEKTKPGSAPAWSRACGGGIEGLHPSILCRGH